MTTINERHYWNTNSYGDAIRIPVTTVRAILATICIVTPFTNWLLPFINKLIRQDVVYRYEKAIKHNN